MVSHEFYLKQLLKMVNLTLDTSGVMNIYIPKGAISTITFSLNTQEIEQGYTMSDNSYILVARFLGDSTTKIDSSSGLKISNHEITWDINAADYDHSVMQFQIHVFNSSLRNIHGRIIIIDALEAQTE